MINQIKQPVFTFVGIVFTSVFLSGCVIHVNAKDQDDKYTKHQSDYSSKGYSSTNKRVNVPQNASTNDISSVNGKIDIDDHVTAKYVSNVNGKIEIGDHVTVDNVKAVNGKIEIGSHFVSSGDIKSVNGAINIDDNSQIGGSINTVNGKIGLEGVMVEQNIITKNGSIKLNKGSVVKGDIVFEEISGYQSWNKNPSLFIDGSSSVEGKIILNREVTLEFENTDLLNQVERNY